VNGLLSSVVLYLVVGLGPVAATYTMLLNGLAELFYHWNVKTPHWIGYVFQRPESHCVHHEEGLHRYNYGDLPVFDMMFGTFRNPREWDARCGFGGEAEHRLKEMLAGKEVV
jgi:sterol desaturase/sphingolipid hydroxylase (fatty acid hydroxylase superfamily)